jgi:hypothetical protein
LFTYAAAAAAMLSEISAYNADMDSKLSPDISHEASTLIMMMEDDGR